MKPSAAGPGAWESLCWRFLAELEEERRWLSEPLEELRVPVEDAHRADWEFKKRVQEIADLKAQLKVLEDQLRRHQEVLLRIADSNDMLKSEVPRWEVDLEQLRAVARPRVEGLSFAAGRLPEKVGGFVAAAPESQVHGGTASSSPGPIVTEYLPQDRQASLQRRLTARRERIDVERERRGAARDAFEELMRTEAEESQLLQDALKEQLTRVRMRREKVRAFADDIVERHLRLQKESFVAGEAAKQNVAKLKEAQQELSSKLSGHLIQRCTGADRVSDVGHQLRQQAANAHETGVLRAREDTSFLREQIEDEKERSSQRIIGLEDQLQALRRRYK